MKFNKEKFIKNGAKEFVGGVYSIKAENWIHKMETTFKAMQVPHRHKTRLAIVCFKRRHIIGGMPWRSLAFRWRETTYITWAEFVAIFND